MSEEQHREARGTHTEALNVLRDIWSADGKPALDIDRFQPSGRVCKNTAMLGIKGMEDETMAEALRSEWKKQLAAEGKLRPGAGSVRDLVAPADEKHPHEKHP